MCITGAHRCMCGDEGVIKEGIKGVYRVYRVYAACNMMLCHTKFFFV